MICKSLNTHGTLSVYSLCRLLTVSCFQKSRFGEIVNSGSQSNSKVQSTLIEETDSIWPEWQKVYVYIKILTPRGCLPLPRGPYTCIKTRKQCIKSDFKVIFLKLATKWGKWQGFSSDIRILSTPAPGLYTCGKTLKNVYKIRIQRDLFETCYKWLKWWGLSVDIKKFVPKGFSAFAPGLYTCIKSFKMCIKSDFKEIILKLATYWHRETAFLLS